MEIRTREQYISYIRRTSTIPQGFDGSTPIKLIEEMVNKLPIDWSNPNLKILDPGFGFGGYLFFVYLKLIQFHSEEHILNNMLHGVEIEDFRFELVKHKLKIKNLIKGDFLDNKIFKDMKFDVILGNPPYQEHEHSSIKLWKKFIIQSEAILKDSGILSFVIPTSWSKPLRSTSKGNDKLCGDIFRKHSLLNYNLNVNSYFKTVGIDISYVTFVKDNNGNNFSHIHKNEVCSNILNKIISKSKSSINLLHYADTPWHRGIKRVDEKSTEFNIPLVENVDKFKYTNIDDVVLRKRKKIHIPRVFGFNFIGDEGLYGLGYQAECILLDEYESVDYALNYFNSKLISTILKEVKWIPQADYSVLELLPKLDFSKNWSDSDLYKEFNLTQEEIDYIENYVG